MLLLYNKYMNSNELQGDSTTNYENQSVNLFSPVADKYIDDKLMTISKETNTEDWKDALIDMQREIGSDNFRNITEKLFIWGAKNKADWHFFKALADMHHGLSIEMQIDNQNLVQVSFACSQAFYDLEFLNDKIRQLGQNMAKVNRRRRENDPDKEFDVTLEEDFKERQKYIENQKRVKALEKDLYEFLIFKGLIDFEEYPWEWLSKSK